MKKNLLNNGFNLQGGFVLSAQDMFKLRGGGEDTVDDGSLPRDGDGD